MKRLQYQQYQLNKYTKNDLQLRAQEYTAEVGRLRNRVHQLEEVRARQAKKIAGYYLFSYI